MFNRQKAKPRIIAWLLTTAMLLSIMPLSVFAVPDGHSVTINGGAHGQVCYDGVTKDSITVNVPKGEGLPEGIEIVSDDRWVPNGFTFPAKVVQAAMANDYTMLLTADGRLYGSGGNYTGQLGLGDKIDRSAFTEVTDCPWVGDTIKAVACDSMTTFALTTGGKIYSTGASYFGRETNSTKFTALTIPGDNPINFIAVGLGGVIALAADGEVYAAGNNFDGLLGLGHTDVQMQFVAIGGENPPWGDDVPVYAGIGQFHSVLLTESGRVYVAGSNSSGRLGLGDDANDNRTAFTLVDVESIRDKKIISATVGWHHTLLLDDEGTLYAAGDNGYSQLGLGNKTNQRAFVPVTTKPWGEDEVTALTAGQLQSAVLTESGAVYVTGYNASGQFGLGNTSNKSNFTKVTSLEGISVSDITMMLAHMIAVTGDGSVYGAGSNGNGQLGPGGNADRKVFTKIEVDLFTVPSLAGITIVHDMTITAQYAEANMVMVSGGNHGQVSFGGETKDSMIFNLPKSETKLPEGIEIVPDDRWVPDGFTFPVRVVQADAGEYHAIVLTEDSRLYSTGRNSTGQLGLGDWSNRNVFTEVTDCPWGEDTIKDVVCMYGGTFVLTTSGKLYSSEGSNRFMEVSIPDDKSINSITAGFCYLLALMTDGTVYGKGINDRGHLGLGDTSNRDNLTPIVNPPWGDDTPVTVTAGYEQSIVLTASGKVYVAGRNYGGLLGLGDGNYNASYPTFTQVTAMNDKTFTAVWAGRTNTFLLDDDGNLYGAGYNQGALGLGDTNPRHTFVQVINPPWGTDRVTEIISGSLQSIVVTESGAAYTAGWNDKGQLGLGDTVDRNVFTKVTALEDKIATGGMATESHTAVFTHDGIIYVTGTNKYGQLGLGDNDDRNVFTKAEVDFFTVPSLADITITHDITITAVTTFVAIQLDITWGALEFTYHEGTWNPDTHSYDGAGWSPDEADGGKITVTNNGNVDLDVTFTYTQIETAISGSFIDGNSLPVTEAVPLDANEQKTVRLVIAGLPEKSWNGKKMGAVTVNINGR